MATIRLRMAESKAEITSPPAFLMILASPFFNPSAAGSSSVSRVSSTRQKNISCKSRNPKLPMPIDSLGFLFYFSFYDLVSNAWWAISTVFLRKYFSCCAAFFAVMIMLFGHIIIIRIFAIYSAKQTTSVELDQ